MVFVHRTPRSGDGRTYGILDSVTSSALVESRAGATVHGVTVVPGSYTIGPPSCVLRVHTSREGVASIVGHDLLIAFRRWSGQLVVEPVGQSSIRIAIDVDLGSLEVLEGTGGAVPLSAGDRAEIAKTASRLLNVDSARWARFTSTSVTSTADGGSVEGTLTLNGASGSLNVDVQEAGPSSWRGSATVVQSSFGIQPYRAFFGALRLADPVTVGVEIELAAR